MTFRQKLPQDDKRNYNNSPNSSHVLQSGAKLQPHAVHPAHAKPVLHLRRGLLLRFVPLLGHGIQGWQQPLRAAAEVDHELLVHSHQLQLLFLAKRKGRHVHHKTLEAARRISEGLVAPPMLPSTRWWPRPWTIRGFHLRVPRVRARALRKRVVGIVVLVLVLHALLHALEAQDGLSGVMYGPQ